MMATLARIKPQIEIEAAARAHEHGRAFGRQARPVRGHENIGTQCLAVLLAQLAQAW